MYSIAPAIRCAAPHGDSFRSRISMCNLMCAAAPVPTCAPRPVPTCAAAPVLACALTGCKAKGRAAPPAEKLVKEAEVSSAQAKLTRYMDITSMQELHGYWTDPTVFTTYIGKDIPIPEEICDAFDGTDRTHIFATVLALSLLRSRFSENSAAWSRVQSKALAWLSSKSSSISWNDVITNLVKLF